MRACRRCGRPFAPKKAFYYWCSMLCRKADAVAAEARPYTAHDIATAFDRGYQAGLAEGLRRTRAARVAPAVLSLDLWRKLAVLIHPDRRQHQPGLLAVSHEAMVWLNQCRPEG
jgi:hypothetical protein